MAIVAFFRRDNKIIYAHPDNKVSVDATACGPMIVMLEDISLMPKVRGGPMNCIECKDLSVQTNTSRFVSMAVTNVDPRPRRKSPAVLSSLVSNQ